MKRKLLFMAAAMMLVLCIIVSASATTMYVNTANRKVLNLRAYNSINADIIGFIPYGAAVTVNTMGGDNTWVPVTYNGKHGYCMMRYLSYNYPGGGVTPPTTDLTSMFTGFSPTYYMATVTPTSAAGFVNLRWAPSMSAPVEPADTKPWEVPSLASFRPIIREELGFLRTAIMGSSSMPMASGASISVTRSCSPPKALAASVMTSVLPNRRTSHSS